MRKKTGVFTTTCLVFIGSDESSIPVQPEDLFVTNGGSLFPLDISWLSTEETDDARLDISRDAGFLLPSLGIAA